MLKKFLCIVLVMLAGVFAVSCGGGDGIAGRWEWQSGSDAFPSLMELNQGAPDWVWSSDGDRLTMMGNVFVFSVDGDTLTLENAEGYIATFTRTR